MSYPNQPPLVPGDGADLSRSSDDDRRDDADDAPETLTGDGDLAGSPAVFAGDDDRPLDPDADDDQISSAAADERAATEGTLDGDVDDRP